jgi:hypothetical protein
MSRVISVVRSMRAIRVIGIIITAGRKLRSESVGHHSSRSFLVLKLCERLQDACSKRW